MHGASEGGLGSPPRMGISRGLPWHGSNDASRPAPRGSIHVQASSVEHACSSVWTQTCMACNVSHYMSPVRPEPDPVLGAVLRRFRHDREATQEQVGHEAGLTTATYAKIELAQSVPAWNTVRRVIAALDVSLVELAEAIEREEA